MNLTEVKDYLKNYDGDDVYIMEVCGTHTAAISENGIPSMLSNKIHLISGPGCPVCVTVSSYIDKLCDLALKDNTVVVTFGDMMRVPGSRCSLSDTKSTGGKAVIVYSPFEIIEMAKKDADTTFVFAAVGFETTTPIYALLIHRLIDENIKNVRLLTALKTMPPVISHLLSNENSITGFIAPGHVAAITGYEVFFNLAKEYSLPFVVSGFEGEELLSSIYALTKLKGKGEGKNFYKSVVTKCGNIKAKSEVDKYFELSDAPWRGMGIIKNSGLKIKDEYKEFDADSSALITDKPPKGCSCADIIMGLKNPNDCPLYKTVCTPDNPVGACMVSLEGSCFNYYINNRT